MRDGEMAAFPRLRDALLRRDLSSFIAKAFHTVNPAIRYQHNWHIDVIAEYLKACYNGEIRRLIINMPPRALKSLCVSVAWPAWILGRDPSARIMAASYAQSLSLKHSLDCRAVMESAWYRSLFPECQWARGQNEKEKFVTLQRGYRLATSVGTGAIGEGGGFLIVDDPLTPYQALSEPSRARANEWFEHSFLPRLDDKETGRVVLVMQRLHPQDLSGYLLKKSPEMWTHLSLPAIAPQREYIAIGSLSYERDAGTALHPERESLPLLEQVRQELGGAAFSAQYQQSPILQEGNMVPLRWFQRYATAPDNPLRIVQSWDTAIKSSAQNDASVCMTWSETERGYYLLDVASFRLEYPDLRRAFLSLADRYQPQVILVEDKASGQSLIQDIRQNTNFPVIAQNPKQDKLTRLAAVSALIEAGRVFLPERAAWLAEFETELCAFPNGAHDDQVDAMSQYLSWVRQCGQWQIRMRSL